MEVGIITFCIGYNYGAMLQAYALVKAIEEIGHAPRLIYYHHPWSLGLDYKDWRNYVGRTPMSTINKIRHILWQKKLYRKFSPMWESFPMTKYYGADYNKLHNDPPQYKCLITGSDQAWNTSANREIFAPYFLDFGMEDAKRISYASSLGNVRFKDEDLSWILSRLERYDAISVREKGDVDYLLSLGLQKVKHMPDPTLIIPRSAYLDFIKNETHHNYDAVIYMLGGENRRLGRNMSKWLKNNGVDLQNVLNITPMLFCCDGVRNRATTVPEWVDAISNAKFVITNSFHCVVFSLIFGRPFIYVKFSGNEKDKNSRVESLIGETSFSHRMVDFDKITSIYDFLSAPDFQREISEFRKQGISYLKTNLMQ